MKKLLLWIGVFILLFNVVYGLPCDNVVDPNITCQMVSPSLSCVNYDYTLFNNDSSINQVGNLSVFSLDLYYFNFSEDVGKYVVYLCDGSTREVMVGGSDSMILFMIILLPILIGLALLYWGSQLSEDSVLPLVFHLFLIPLAWLSIHFAVIAVGNFYPNLTELITTLADLTYYLGWVFFIVGAYMAYRLLIGIVEMFNKRKSDKENEKYG